MSINIVLFVCFQDGGSGTRDGALQVKDRPA